jgi:arsenate reductase (thioredoxin)
MTRQTEQAKKAKKPKKTRVMFVCIGNACRSPMAEAIARQEAEDVMEITSAGLIPMGYVPQMTLATLTRNGYSIDGLDSKPIDGKFLAETDLVINLSGYERERALASAAKIEHWPVDDPYGEDAGIYQKILEDIRGRIRDLAERLRKEQIREKVKE